MSIHYLPLKAIKRERKILSLFKSGPRQDLNLLQNSIEADGLLNPLLVVKSGDTYVVVDGHKRLTAIRRLSKAKRYERRYSKIPCLIQSESTLVIVTSKNKPLLLNDQELAHNVIRASRGQSSLSNIAKRFACDLSVATKCLKLENLNRDILKLFSNGILSLDQAAALSMLRNKQRQSDILLKLGPSASSRKIMKAIDSQEKYLSSANENFKAVKPRKRSNMRGFLAA